MVVLLYGGCVHGSLEDDGSGLDDSWGVDGGAVVYDGVETVVVVSGVLHGPDGAVSLNEGVGALYDITVAGFLLLLVVSGVSVSYRVTEIVFRVSL